MHDILYESPLETGAGERREGSWKHWQLRVDDQDLAWLLLDQHSQDGRPTSTNSLSRHVLEELGTLLDHVSTLDPRAIVIRSGKSGAFIVGADISEFRDLTDAGEVRSNLEEAHRSIRKLVAMPCPTIAVIHGHCLGGGLELALACDWRLARSDASLGFPEVQLGLHPGLGGTVRLPELIDPAQALKMMLTGKPVRAAEARELGLVDEVIEERHVRAAVTAAAVRAMPRHRLSIRGRLMNSGLGRRFVADRARKQTEGRVRKDHYPAPFALLDLFESGGDSFDEMIDAELDSFANLLLGETARNLVRVFFLRQQLAGTGSDEIRHVHVVGAGAMGGDIAAWLALHGKTVSIEDQSADMISPAIRRAHSLYEHKLDDAHARRDALDRLVPDPAGHGRRRADLVIEAVPEKVDLKREILASLESVARADAIIATNTSSILLSDLREVLERPERLAGLHFFNPVAKMPLVEVVGDDRVDEDVMARLMALCSTIDKQPVRVKSRPGFLVNRILTPYLLEALAMLDEGIQAEAIDEAAEAFGMPLGPIELADQIGLDICLDVADTLTGQIDQPLASIPDWLRRKVDDGDLGVKSGKGLYEYDEDGKAKKKDIEDVPGDEKVDRLMLPIINTAAWCLAEEICEGPDALDAAVIFGTGFAPFRGGPVHYARSRGIADIESRLEALAEEHGERFRPAPGFKTLLE